MSLEFAEKREDFFYFLENARYRDSIGISWERLDKLWAKFRLRLVKFYADLGKFWQLFWANFLLIWASLGKCLGKFALIQAGLGNFALAQILEGILIKLHG